MVLRTVLFLSLVALVACQSGEMMPTEAPENLDERYETIDARLERRNHFYCLDVNQTDFPNDDIDLAGRVASLRRWAVFLQYPVLNYLDTMGKARLISVTQQLAQIGGVSVDLDNFCIADVVQYGVSTYEESVLINFYFEDDLVSITNFDTAFRSGFSSEAADPNSVLIQRFFGRNAYVINLPGASAQGLDPDQDPTQRAVVLGSYVGDTSIERARGEMNLGEFVDNPNPINFGLEAGDIIFAVFGSIFLAIVGFLTVLGFCIHPFFLA